MKPMIRSVYVELIKCNKMRCMLIIRVSISEVDHFPRKSRLLILQRHLFVRFGLFFFLILQIECLKYISPVIFSGFLFNINVIFLYHNMCLHFSKNCYILKLKYIFFVALFINRHLNLNLINFIIYVGTIVNLLYYILQIGVTIILVQSAALTYSSIYALS